MEAMIKAGMFILFLLVIWAMLALLVAIFKYAKRSGVLKLGISNNEAFNRSFKAWFVEDALHKDKQVHGKSMLLRAIIAVVFIFVLGSVVFLAVGS
jgi:hypothetical protein